MNFFRISKLSSNEILIINNFVASIVVILSILADVLNKMFNISGERIGLAGCGMLMLFYFTPLSNWLCQVINELDSKPTKCGKFSDQWLSLIAFLGAVAFILSKIGYTDSASKTMCWIVTIVLIMFGLTSLVSLGVLIYGTRLYGEVEVIIIIGAMLGFVFVITNWVADGAGIEFMERMFSLFCSFKY